MKEKKGRIAGLGHAANPTRSNMVENPTRSPVKPNPPKCQELKITK